LYPNSNFWFENKPSGNPGVCRYTLKEKCNEKRFHASVQFCLLFVGADQGDQIERIVYFGKCFENYQVAQMFGLLFSEVPVMYT
jgi:hypothetical protein